MRDKHFTHQKVVARKMRLFSICGPTGSAETVTVVVVTLRPGIGARPVVTDRLASRDRPTPTPAQALELCTHIGQAHGRWSCTARGSPTPVPISNAGTQLSRLWADPAPGCRLEPRDRAISIHAQGPALHSSHAIATLPMPTGRTGRFTGFGFRTFLSRDLPRPGSFGLQTNQLRRPTQPQVSGHHLFAPADDRQVGE